ncbi:MAG: hypothetical protein IKI04_00625, partial [Bacilli bacterium]|nr:hypothetical protein [Bacilli bacterium]
RSSHTYSEFTSQEISSFSLSSSHTYYGSAYRLIKKLEPSVICPSSSDAYTKSNTLGNGRLDNPIGLLTSDEIRMAGEGTVYYSNSGVGYKNQTYYLYNGGYWWTMSPYGWHGANATVLDMDPDYALMGYTVSNARGVRPSVSLKPGTVLTGGDGTSASPYTVE